MPTNPGHSIHRRESGGAVFSSDDFKFRQGTCFYIALPIGIVATLNMVLLIVEGITRVRNAPDEKQVGLNLNSKIQGIQESYRKGSTPSDKQNLLKEVTPIYLENSLESASDQNRTIQEAQEKNWI